MPEEQTQSQNLLSEKDGKKKSKPWVVVLVILIPAILFIGVIIWIKTGIQNNEEVENEVPEVTQEATKEDKQTSQETLLPDTGQTNCSNNSIKVTCPNQGDAFFGQDAQYSGNKMSFTDNKDGTVTDDNTGLMWQQDPGEKMDYQDAANGADSFKLAGYTDWRLPTIKELYSLINFNGMDPNPQSNSTTGLTPFIDTTYFSFEYGDISKGDRIIDSQWATSTINKSKVMNKQECFFGVNFADGRIKCYPTRAGKGYFVIYVRGEDYGINDFSDNKNRTISDNATSLVWQQDDNGEGVNWENALTYCEQLELAGKSDWRLPNAKELQSIVDYSRSPDTTNSAAIDSLFETTSITNEAGQADYPFYWTSTTHIRYPDQYQDAVYISFGRALGYMKEFGGWIDVHGAGAQRSDPKTGDPSQFEFGLGPQGDARRIYNYVRCVRDIEELSIKDTI